MCGITGFVDKKGKLSQEEKNKLLEKMLASIRHRGNDGAGVYVHGSVAIAHARLSIIDLSKTADQPMQNDNDDIVLSFNGELYDHQNIRKELEKKHKFHTSHSDTETLLRAYEEWGEDCVGKFRGMFAFSVYDLIREHIFLAVDRFGIKPLYYVDTQDWFAWSSEIKSLLLLPGVTRDMNNEVLGEHMIFRSIAGPQTLFKNIYKILPGESLRYIIKDNSVVKKTYWRLNEYKFLFASSDRQAEITRLLKRSVAEHMLADVPVGVQLSGGVDSSLISALVKQVIPKDQELHSFSIGLSEPEWNEFPHSRLVAKMLGTVHHEIIFTEEDFCRSLPIATYHLDEPINHSHSVPMMLLAEYAAKHVKVLMSGEGADEVFGGYRRYVDLLNSNPTLESIMLSSAFSQEKSVQPFMSGIFNADLSFRGRLLNDMKSDDPYYQVAIYDLATYVTPLLLRQDKMGMRSTLENRVPFLDHDLVLSGLHLNDYEKIERGEAKALLKKIASEFLPNEIIYRPKVGFGQPISAWLRNENGLGRYLRLLSAPKIERSFFNYVAINSVINAHLSGVEDNSGALWTLLNLELWMQIFFDGKSPESIWDSLC